MDDFDHSAQALVSEHTDRTDCGKLNGERRFTGHMEPTTIDGEFTGRSIHKQATQFRLPAENGVASHSEASLNQSYSPNWSAQPAPLVATKERLCVKFMLPDV
ncbi:MAG: hypothetical protein IH991_15350 [Planctomycetes bacterium]|nr:hypothetical protein [Planctomycetota bacterium]